MTFAARYIGWIKSSLYQIQRSLRFRVSASPYLSKSFATGFTQKVTASFWVKRGGLGGNKHICVGDTGTVYAIMYFDADRLAYITTAINDGNSYGAVTSSVLRDPSAWYHVVFVEDTTLAVAADRVKFWVNGVLQPTSALNAGYPIQNSNSGLLRTGFPMQLGAFTRVGGYLDGYLSECYFVSGQALTQDSFGQINAITGQWSAKQYVGTYGTNGFYLDFSDNSSLTNLCLDRSGNGNHFTANNISLTAGATYDSVLDVPLGGDNVVGRGNYCTMNPLRGAAILTAGNLDVAQNAAAYVGKTGTVGVSTDKWYWEFVVGTVPTVISVGIADEVWATNGLSAGCYFYHYNGGKYIGGSNQAYSGNGYTTGDVLGFALDMVAGTLTCYKNNISQGVLVSGLTGTLFPAITLYGSGGGNYNFGQRPFAYTPPAGFKALHTGNLVSETVAVSGSFTGNASADGFFAWMNGAPETLTINGNAVTFGTHADKTAGGFKLRTSSSSYNASGTNTWTATVLSPSTKSAFKHQNAKGNP